MLANYRAMKLGLGSPTKAEREKDPSLRKKSILFNRNRANSKIIETSEANDAPNLPFADPQTSPQSPTTSPRQSTITPTLPSAAPAIE